ncbi:MAG: Dipeptide transport system permease protein DppC [Dehalococcoidia bacterium]|nr:Dipeptide transport system permease protein DppC [candidate division NPL-UPA2 bacterium]MBT9140911.1 Dipeptide transport system permease protein DppC [Bacillota bacterium]MBT9142825.1 Dipeptide transport system permease protein DppC [Bacillota bacterium]
MKNFDALSHPHRLTRLNRRQSTLIVISLSVIFLLGLLSGGLLTSDAGLSTNLTQRTLLPSLEHPFGTDWLGRDMLVRTLKGLTLSFGIGLAAATASALIALVLGLTSALAGRHADIVITWLVDLFLAVPHLVLLILIAFVFGGGTTGVIAGVSLTHWPALTRLLRAEVLQLRSADFVQISRRLGRSRWWVATRHLLPHLKPQLLVGFVLLFPHAILHEAAITFLGFGLSPHRPAIGVILSEAMRHLSAGSWWLAFFPGLALLVMVRVFDILGENIRLLLDPRTAHE